MTKIAVADIGGTHARFALAGIENGRVVSLSDPVTLKTAEHGSFQLAWRSSAGARHWASEGSGGRLCRPRWRRDAQAYEQPVGDPSRVDQGAVGGRPLSIVNDFGAVAYAVATLQDNISAICAGPSGRFPTTVVSIVGPGTGLGVAALYASPAAMK